MGIAKRQRKKVGAGTAARKRMRKLGTKSTVKADAKKAKTKPPPSPHTWEGTYLTEDHDPGCVNRHVSQYSPGNVCSHRAQARLQAVGESKKYTWPKSAPKQPDSPKEWDISVAENFAYSSRLPFWHEAHHIVANAELKGAIMEAGKGLTPKAQIPQMIRSGLLREKYNLNNKVNMIILPMVRYAAVALGLPLHRKTPAHWHHQAYSSYINKELIKIFGWIKQNAKDHKVPDYSNSRDQIEQLSIDTYSQLLQAGQQMKLGKMGGDSLEDIPHTFLEKGRKGMKASAPP